MKILSKQDLGRIAHLPPDVRQRAAEVVDMLDRHYGANRDHLNADGGWVEVIEDRRDLEEFGGIDRLHGRETSDPVGSEWLEVFLLSNNETGVTVLLPSATDWLPEDLAAEMAAEAGIRAITAGTNAVSARKSPLMKLTKIRTGIYPLAVSRRLVGILEREMARAKCDVTGGVAVRFTAHNHTRMNDGIAHVEVAISAGGKILRLGDAAVESDKRPGTTTESGLRFDFERTVVTAGGHEIPMDGARVLFDSWQHRFCHDYQSGLYRADVVPL